MSLRVSLAESKFPAHYSCCLCDPLTPFMTTVLPADLGFSLQRVFLPVFFLQCRILYVGRDLGLLFWEMCAYPISLVTWVSDSSYTQSSHSKIPRDLGDLCSDKESCTWILYFPHANLCNFLFQDDLGYQVTKKYLGF